MALLTPNSTFKINGVTVKEKIIPDGTRWKDSQKAIKAGFFPNSLYKLQKKLTNNTGKALSVTIHNTNDIKAAYDDGEQYTRATYNENMGSVLVHFYVDDVCAWLNMKAGTGLCANDPLGCAEVTYHAGDGTTPDGGNMTSISIEVIMNDNAAHDAKAYDNAARIAAWLLWRHDLSIDKLLTHTYWVNKKAKKSFADVDKQCTNPIKGKKWCPAYIFNSSNPTVALTNWLKFKDTVQRYLVELTKKEDKPALQIGDKVKLTADATQYGKTARFKSWVYNSTLYVRSISENRVVISTLKTGAVTGAVDIKHLIKI